MKTLYSIACIALLLAAFNLIVFTLVTHPLQAQNGEFAIEWWTLDGGGGESRDDGFTLHATFGQPDAGMHSADGYAIQGGFWTDGTAPSNIYLPLLHHADAP